MATDGTQSFVIYYFEDINWAAGTTNGGNSNTGLGGTGAQVMLILMALSLTIMDLIRILTQHNIPSISFETDTLKKKKGGGGGSPGFEPGTSSTQTRDHS